MLMRANGQRQTRDGKKIIIAVTVSTDVIHHQLQQQVDYLYHPYHQYVIDLDVCNGNV